MRGFVSFHPIDLGFFDAFIAPLLAGGKIDPEPFVVRAARIRRNGWIARRYAVAVEQLAAASEAPRADPTASRWRRLRTNLERIDFHPDELARRAALALDPDLHVDGRPFFTTEGSAERVAGTVDAYAEAGSEVEVGTIARNQLAHLDVELTRGVEPADLAEPSSDLSYRSELLGLLTKIHDLGRWAREGRNWVEPDVRPRPAVEALPDELPWRAVSMHARVSPFWIARDVDGLETICRASGVSAPDGLSPAWRVFAEACEAFPALKERLGLELNRPRDVGAFVAPTDIAALIQFLTDHGARIIGAATRKGEGAAAATLLRKMKECAVYAHRHGFAYLEVSGVLPPERE